MYCASLDLVSSLRADNWRSAAPCELFRGYGARYLSIRPSKLKDFRVLYRATLETELQRLALGG